MNRWWLLTWTTYGSWLPGDARDFVGTLPRQDGPREWQNVPGTPPRERAAGLESAARSRLRGPPIELAAEHARILMRSFQYTSRRRGWRTVAAAVMRTHVHLVVGVRGDPDGAALLRDFKAFGSHELNGELGTRTSGTWWTSAGSRQVLASEANVLAAIEYVRHQKQPLAIEITTDPFGSASTH